MYYESGTRLGWIASGTTASGRCYTRCCVSWRYGRHIESV